MTEITPPNTPSPVPESPEPQSSQVRSSTYQINLFDPYPPSGILLKIDDLIHDYVRPAEARIEDIKRLILTWEENRG